MDLFSESTRRAPYPVYARLRAAGPVLHLPELDLWVALSYDAVKRVLHDHAAFSSNVGPTRNLTFEWLLFTDPPRHTELRGLISRAFTSRSIAALEPRIRELSRTLLAGVGDDIDLVASYASPLPMMVIAEILGLPSADWPMFARWSEAIVNLGNTIAGTDAEAEAASRAFAAADAEMAGYLADRAHTALMARLAEAGLTPSEVVRFCQLLITGGDDRPRRPARAVPALRAGARLAAARLVPRPWARSAALATRLARAGRLADPRYIQEAPLDEHEDVGSPSHPGSLVRTVHERTMRTIASPLKAWMVL